MMMMMMSNTTSCSHMPPECMSLILAFVPLKDVLHFGSTSKRSLVDVLPELSRRRSRMSLRFACAKKSRRRPTSTSDVPSSTRIVPWRESNASSSEDNDLVSLPTVEERLDQLIREMPSNHMLWEDLRELGCELRRPQMAFDELFAQDVSFDDVKGLFHKLVQPLRLFASILARTINSNPFEKDTQSTSLGQYMGDVLILTYLLNFQDLGIVECGPSNAEYMQELRRCRTDESVPPCYRAWVHIHSSILRTKDFTPEQRKRLGIPVDEASPKISEMIPNDCYMAERFLSSDMRLASYEFGPLGGRFRGRDVVQVREISARCLVAYFVTENVLVPGETARTALEWLFFTSQEMRKARPMAVRPPKITFCRPNPAV